MVLPDGFSIPPLPVLVVLFVALLAVAGALYRRKPPVTRKVVVAFAPWMVVGSSLYVLYQIEGLPQAIAPFFSSPTVYGSTFVIAGAIWALVAGRPADEWSLRAAPGLLAATGLLGVVLVAGATLAIGSSSGLMLFWPAVGLVVSVILATLVWAGVRVGLPDITKTTGSAGALVVFAHTLDGVSTAVGIDALNFGEQTPLSRAIIEFAAALPTAEVLGTVWLFVLVKIALATVVVTFLAESVRDRPREGYLLLALVAAVGLGPGAHNLLLFTVLG
ncbi:DUF63 family protein [Haladaptatus sp. DYSN1]|uniref:DUF63 family protein n=1 Tax=unclassified Haladaptatus TaxID=2622732 RepID=UPI002406D9FF|nr:DUF63 family protein [Haladaptatus sp. DYSN1]